MWCKNISLWMGKKRSSNEFKSKKVQQYWNKGHKTINYADIDGSIIKEFTDTHPKIVQNWYKERDFSSR